MDTGGQILSRFSMADYEAAIRQMPPGSLLMLGDLDKMADEKVQCTTCQMVMPKSAAPYHVHPKPCGICGDTFDENMQRHDPVHVDKDGGAGTVRYTSGCKVTSL
jgi:hypothetical protein